MENKPDDDVNSLENPDTPVDSAASSPDTSSGKDAKKPTAKATGVGGKFRGLISRLNIYLIIFIFIVVLVSGFTFISIQRNKKEGAAPTTETKSLSAEDLQKINGTDASVGDPKQTLSVESNTIFSGKVLVRDTLDVAGGIRVGGALSISGLSVSGTSTFDQIQANRLSVSSDTNIQGQLTVQKTLTVSGGASFGGPISAPQITVQSFQLTGDLQLNRHIDAGGTTPGKSDGNALGAGGTVSVSGTDTAGTIAINTGGGPGAGCFVTVIFSQKFNSTPHVVVTPVGSAAAGLNFYVTRNTDSFQLCTTNPAPGGANFSFDWIAVD